jgi:hypothetical protein
MVYTRYFWSAAAVHATLPACPFLTVTGHPCPFCGGTRSFAYMWQADVRHALALYPLGPLLFVATLVAMPVLIASVVMGRTVGIRLSGPWQRAVALVVVLTLAGSWALKLTVLPN